MTGEEQRQYNSLSYEARQEYDDIKRKRPHWSHNQIMAKLATIINIDKMIEEGKGNPAEDPKLLKEVLEGAKAFLIGVGCFIWDVFEAIDDAINTLTSMIASGIRYIGDKLEEFWDWLTS